MSGARSGRGLGGSGSFGVYDLSRFAALDLASYTPANSKPWPPGPIPSLCTPGSACRPTSAKHPTSTPQTLPTSRTSHFPPSAVGATHSRAASHSSPSTPHCMRRNYQKYPSRHTALTQARRSEVEAHPHHHSHQRSVIGPHIPTPRCIAPRPASHRSSCLGLWKSLRPLPQYQMCQR